MLVKEDEHIECCNKCKSLYLIDEDIFHVVCHKCNSLNDIEVMENIDIYLEKYGYIWSVN